MKDCESGAKKNVPRQLYLILGLSGAGKSTALRVFEDLHYFAVDGLPPELIPEVAAIMNRDVMRHYPGMAIGMDLRQEDFLAQFNLALDKLSQTDLEISILFLEADDKMLMRRYAATRRPHPLEMKKPGLEAAIAAERVLLLPLKDKADVVIDSSGFSIHDLRRVILSQIRKEGVPGHAIRVNLISFGFKYGLPNDADFVFDLRFLDNPYFVERLRPLSGRDEEVAGYVFRTDAAVEFRAKLLDLLFFTLKQMEAEGRYRVTIAMGCTGGRHRSVAMAEAIGKALRQAKYPLTIEHRNIDADVMQKGKVEEKQGG